MAKTQINQPTVYPNGATFYSYPCRFEDLCQKYNPALTLTDKRGVTLLNKCTHGGGVGCASWKHRVNQTIKVIG